MKQVINELIQTDKECRLELNKLEEKEENIDDYITNQLEKIKEEINDKYQYKINFKKSENDRKLKQKKEELTNNTNKEIERWEQEFLSTKDNIVNDIIYNILKRR